MITKDNYDLAEIEQLLQKGTKSIAPLWSLDSFVAVNPYMGMSSMPFDEAMQFLHTCSGAEATLPMAFYLDALEKGVLTREDIADTLAESTHEIPRDVDTFIQNLYKETHTSSYQVSTLMDVASEINGKKWRRFIIDRISQWASVYFDRNQAVWNTALQADSLFTAWKKDAEIDLGPDTMGLHGFRKLIRSLPDDHIEAAAMALQELGLQESMLEIYFNSLLLKMNGWAGFVSRIDWDAGLKGEISHALEEFLVILLVWEMSLMRLLPYEGLSSQWRRTKSEIIGTQATDLTDDSLAQKLLLQKAFDHANQRKLKDQFEQSNDEPKQHHTPEVQAVFCIDVRSEVMRRNLEAAHKNIETMGFAGFFGFPIKYKPMGYEEGMDQCPVLLTPSHAVTEGMPSQVTNGRVIDALRLRAHLRKAWKAFKSGAISCFSFVSPMGLFYVGKLLTDALGLTRPVSAPNRAGLSPRQLKYKQIELDDIKLTEQNGIPMSDRVKLAAGALKGMSLTSDFAPVVLLVGHGASTTNNPHATGLDCGACGGHSGEANAKVAAAVLNDPHVRKELAKQGIPIPNSTVFIAALHDTTTDHVELYTNDKISSWHMKKINGLKQAFNIAGDMCRLERSARMNLQGKDVQRKMMMRSKDWSQVRPEWGLAGCSAFVVAPRVRTASLNLEGKAFMHSYDWHKDSRFEVLEMIMTAPMVVTSWINLQYYASTVDNKRFGSGNKALHNVVGGMGVLEGFSGDLRVGLPWQSVNDGKQFQHEPQRLNVYIEAPVDEMSKILERNPSIKELCDNEWIFLFALNDQGKVAYKYIGDLQWELIR